MTILTASLDNAQQILGSATICITLIDTDNHHIKIPMPFYIVSGLRHDIFIGQGLLSTNLVLHDRPESLTLNSLTPNKFHTIKKLFHVKPPTSKKSKAPAKRRKKKKKTTTCTSCSRTQSTSDPVGSPRTPDGPPTHHAATPCETLHSNAAVSAVIYIHSSFKEELQLQRHQLRVNGCYQIPANKVIHSSETISSLEHNGNDSFIPKNNEALLKCLITDHLQSDQAAQARQLIEKHMNVFQRHQLNFGLLPDFEVDIKLTETDPPNRVDK